MNPIQESCEEICCIGCGVILLWLWEEDEYDIEAHDCDCCGGPLCDDCFKENKHKH